VSWVTFGHGVSWFEGGVGDFGYGELFVISFFGRDDGGIRRKHEVDSWIWDQIGLEFGDINV
jgi:hypothetical protein